MNVASDIEELIDGYKRDCAIKESIVKNDVYTNTVWYCQHPGCNLVATYMKTSPPCIKFLCTNHYVCCNEEGVKLQQSKGDCEVYSQI